VRQSVIVSAFVALIAGCQFGTPVQGTGGCERDADCANFEICEIETGLCLCDNDNACDATEFCNDQGRCQERSGCEANDDCFSEDRPNSICDTTTGECVELNATTLQCTLGSHCPFGSFCDGNVCTPGCQDNGDCQLGEPCLNGQCDPTPGACNQNGYCEFGQACDISTNRCGDHPERSSLCATCDPSSLTACPNSGPCLIDSSIPPDNCTDDSQCSQYGAQCQPRVPVQCNGDDSICGVGGSCGLLTGVCNCGGFSGATCPAGSICQDGLCFLGQCGKNFCGTTSCDDDTNPCPRGYSCFRLITVTGQSCQLGDNTCQGGRVCQVGGENEVAGFCSCIEDADCGFGNTCDNPGPFGACVTGTTCGPQQGLLCEDLQ
jgi:hypothetical protein